MRFRIRFASQIVGVFLLVAIGLFVFILISMGANQRWFARNFYYYSTFSSARGLSVGMPIEFKGFQIGKITDIELTEDNEVRTTFYIEDRYIDKVHENSILQLVTNPLGLGGGLLFHQGREETEPIPEFSYIPSWNTKEARFLVEQNRVIVPRNQDPVNDILTQLQPILENVNRVLVSLDTAMVQIAGTLSGESQGPMADILREADEAIAQLDTVIANVDTITANLAVASEEMRDPTGLATRLIDPQGSIETFLDDDNEIYDRIDEILEGLNESVAQLEELSRFANDSTPQLAGLLEEGRRTLDTGQDVLEGLANNPLLRGGITRELEQPDTFDSYRDDAF
jgi:phospholipid/cholesterol/gamma-HCH transport system substrate-binding protein